MSNTVVWQTTAAAARQQEANNRPSVTVCTLSMIIIGILMIFAGGLMTYIYFTEITPPNYDAYYQRYVGSSFPRIVGILLLMAGLTLFWGASIFLVYANWRKSSSSSSSSSSSRRNPPHVDGPTPTRYYFADEAQVLASQGYAAAGQPPPMGTTHKENYVA